MSQKPIIFSGPMVVAILRGYKHMTRRVVKPQPEWFEQYGHGHWLWCGCIRPNIQEEIVSYAPHQPGDILYVREKWRLVDFEYVDRDFNASVQFADETVGERLHHLKHGINERTGWRSPIHMPRAAARIFLRVVDVRVERLNEITEEDAQAEGFEMIETPGYYGSLPSFEAYWNNVNAKRGYGWDRNPWVWVYSFERTEAATNG